METTNLWVKGRDWRETASFRAPRPSDLGDTPSSPVQYYHPWQSSACTTCGWSVSLSWVSRLSLRPGKLRRGDFHSQCGDRGQQAQKSGERQVAMEEGTDS